MQLLPLCLFFPTDLGSGLVSLRALDRVRLELLLQLVLLENSTEVVVPLQVIDQCSFALVEGLVRLLVSAFLAWFASLDLV